MPDKQWTETERLDWLNGALEQLVKDAQTYPLSRHAASELYHGIRGALLVTSELAEFLNNNPDVFLKESDKTEETHVCEHCDAVFPADDFSHSCISRPPDILKINRRLEQLEGCMNGSIDIARRRLDMLDSRVDDLRNAQDNTHDIATCNHRRCTEFKERLDALEERFQPSQSQAITNADPGDESQLAPGEGQKDHTTAQRHMDDVDVLVKILADGIAEARRVLEETEPK